MEEAICRRLEGIQLGHRPAEEDIGHDFILGQRRLGRKGKGKGIRRPRDPDARIDFPGVHLGGDIQEGNRRSGAAEGDLAVGDIEFTVQKSECAANHIQIPPDDRIVGRPLYGQSALEFHIHPPAPHKKPGGNLDGKIHEKRLGILFRLVSLTSFRAEH